MRLRSLTLAMLALSSFAVLDATWAHDSDARKESNVQVGVRPFFLVDGMDNSRLKEKLQRHPLLDQTRAALRPTGRLPRRHRPDSAAAVAAHLARGVA